MIYNIKEWVLRSPDTVQTLNRILKHYYNTRVQPIPENHSVKTENPNCTLMFCRHKGKYIRVAELDFKMDYPSIVRGLKLNPSADDLRGYSYILDYLMDCLNDPRLEPESRDKIKRFITKMCSGWLNCEEFIFCDSSMHRRVLSFGKEIMQKAIEITDSNPNFKILRVHTDGMYVHSLSPNNIRLHFNNLVDEINQGIKLPFMTIKIKSLWTEVCFFTLNDAYLYNSYTKELKFLGMGELTYNYLRRKGKLMEVEKWN